MDTLAPEMQEYLSDDEGDAFSYPEFTEDWGNVIVVDNLPKIPMAKHDKLAKVLTRIFEQTGTITSLTMPAENEKTLGVAFVEFETNEEATKAIRLTDGYALDKSHVFKVNVYADLSALADLPATYTPRKKEAFAPRLNPNSWLGDTLHRDQFAIRYNNETEIKWAERAAPPSLEYGGEREKEGGLYWCEQYVKWSPQGSVLATFHNKGIALWGDEAFTKQGRFAHNSVKQLDFSPRENYMCTANENMGDKRGVVFWDLRSRKELRAFEVSFLPAPPPMGPEGDDEPPTRLEPAHFKFSCDDALVARRAKDKSGGDVIGVYELPSMALLGKKSLRADGVRDFDWSPAASVLAYWAPEMGNTPARVTLVELPSRRELRQKNLVNVSDCKLYWHPDGNYLCVKVIRHTKSKKTLFFSFELFRVDVALVPVEGLEMKDTVHSFAWEPNGHRFGVVHGDGSKPSVSFYSMLSSDGKRQELTHLVTLENRSCNSLHWSPMGTHVVLAGTGDAFNGALEFYDVDLKWSKPCEHYRCNAVEWDPSGRIVATGVLQPLEGAFFKFQMDNGYKLWTFQGTCYHEVAYENFYQLAWRPRPKSLLDADQKKKIVKNLRKYERMFANEDKIKDLARQREATTEKRQARKWIRELIKQRASNYANTAHVRKTMRNGVDADSDALFHVTKKTIETCTKSLEEIIG